MERTGSHKFAHLTNPILPVGMNQSTSVLMKIMDHASEETEVRTHEPKERMDSAARGTDAGSGVCSTGKRDE